MMRSSDEHALLRLHNAVQNATSRPASDDDLLAILRGGGGHAPHVRAVFEDISLQGLFPAGRAHGIAAETILAAYAAARPAAALATPELDATFTPDW